MKVIGTGLGRTGTYSLRTALDMLGFGPCYHMENVAEARATRVPHWAAALDGTPDWPATFAGFNSGVDWPIASFYSDLATAYPKARFVHTTRRAEDWAESFGQTIATLLVDPDAAPPEMRDWLHMVVRVVARVGVRADMDKDALAEAFRAHDAAVQAALPAERLLVFDVRQGWEPLCAFLGTDRPEGDFPRTNDRTAFFDLVARNA